LHMERPVVRIAFAIVLVAIVLTGGALWQNRPITWSEQRQLTHGSGDSRLVDLAPSPSGSALHLSWEDTRDDATEVYYKRSLDDGVTWGPDVRLSDLAAGTVEPEPRVGTDGKTVLVFFANQTPGGERILYVSSADGGASFSQPVELTGGSGDQSDAAVAFVGPTVHLVYQHYLNNGDERLFYLKSPDVGVSWQQTFALTNTAGAQDRYAAISAVDNYVFVAWCRFYHNQEAIYVRSSLDAGASWGPEIQVSDYGAPSYQDFPDIASNGTEVHVVWVNQGIQYSHSSVSGSTWSSPIPITNTTRQYLAPRLSVAQSRVQVAAAAISTVGTPPNIEIDSDVWYLISSDGGESWTKPFSLTMHRFKVLSLAPVIRNRGDASFVAWEDNRNGRLAIFFISRPDFALIHDFERKLIAILSISLAVTTAIYFVLARIGLTKHRRGKVRRRRPRSRLTRHRSIVKKRTV
jgi:hypothetical protein